MRRSILTAGVTAAFLVGGLMTPALAVETTLTPDPSPTVSASSETSATPETPATTATTETPATVATTGPSAEPTEEVPATQTPSASETAPERIIAPSPTPSINVGDEGIIGGYEQYTDDAHITSVIRNGCVLTFTVQINTAGTYSIEIWDDGENIATLTVTGEAGTTQTASYTMTANVGTGAWGYDFVVLTADGTEVEWMDWDFEGSEQVMTQCAAIAASASASPSTSAATPAAVPAAQLARTGAETAGLALGAMFLVTAGGVALRVARRRA